MSSNHERGPKMPSNDAIWMRRGLNWTEIAEEYQMDPEWLGHTASGRGFQRDQGGRLLYAPCKQCERPATKEELEPYRVCTACREHSKHSSAPWWNDYNTARLAFLAKMAEMGYRRGDLIEPKPEII